MSNSDKFKPGTRIYYTGDAANYEGYGTITKFRPAWQKGLLSSPQSVDITFDDERFESDEDKSTQGIFLNMFDPGPCQRFWLADEWEADYQRRIKESQQRMREVLAQ